MCIRRVPNSQSHPFHSVSFHPRVLRNRLLAILFCLALRPQPPKGIYNNIPIFWIVNVLPLPPMSISFQNKSVSTFMSVHPRVPRNRPTGQLLTTGPLGHCVPIYTLQTGRRSWASILRIVVPHSSFTCDRPVFACVFVRWTV